MAADLSQHEVSVSCRQRQWQQKHIPPRVAVAIRRYRTRFAGDQGDDLR